MTPLVRALLIFLGLTLVFTFTLAGFGLWKVYDLHRAAFYTTAILYVLSISVTCFLGYRFFYCLRVDVNDLVKKIKLAADQLVKELEVLTTNPLALLKAIKKILALLKPKSKE